MMRAFKSMIVSLLFSSAISTIAVQAADDEVRLRGVASVRYELVWPPEVMFGGRENDCKVDRGTWQAAMDSVANKSDKLKFVSRQAESDAWDKDLRDGKCHMDFKDRDDLPSCFALHQQKPMPELRFFVTVAKIENTCLAQVDAKIWDGVVGQTKFRSTERDALVRIAEMWRSTYWIKPSEPDFTRAVAEFSAMMMKELLDEWTRVNSH